MVVFAATMGKQCRVACVLGPWCGRVGPGRRFRVISESWHGPRATESSFFSTILFDRGLKLCFVLLHAGLIPIVYKCVEWYKVVDMWGIV